MKAFVCYSSIDRVLAQQITKHLTASGIEVFYDAYIPSGQWEEKLAAEIVDCNVFLYLLSKESLDSYWCKWEFNHAVSLGKTIIPVILRANVLESLPNILSKLQFVNASDGISDVEVITKLMRFILTAPHEYKLSKSAKLPLQAQNDAEAPPQVNISARQTPVVQIDFVEVKAGKFVLTQEVSDQIPTFFISKYPVTYRQYEEFVNANDGFADDECWSGLNAPTQIRREPREQYSKYDNFPADNISWYEAMAFCRWLTKQLRKIVTLPTEAQWVKAARGNKYQAYPYGSEYQTSMSMPKMQYAVGSYPENVSAFGLFDMCGNVWEWCLDNPQPNQHVVKGGPAGTWNRFIADASIDIRRTRLSSNRGPFGDIGFRIVTSVDEN